MANIRMRFKTPDTGEYVAGKVVWQLKPLPTAEPLVDGQDAIITQGVEYDVPAEGATITTRATEFGWYYHVSGTTEATETRPGGWKFYTDVYVPDDATYDLEELITLNPKQPFSFARPEPMWWDALDQLTELYAEGYSEAAVRAEAGAAEAERQANRSRINADRSESAMTGAETARDQAQQAASTAANDTADELRGEFSELTERAETAADEAETASGIAEGYRDELAEIVDQAVADGFPLATENSAGLMSAEDKVKLDGFVTPEQFGAVGDGVVDDTEAFREMLAGSARRFSPDPAKRYRISGQLDFGRTSTWVTPLRILLTGSRNAEGASLGVQFGETSQHRTALFVQGEHRGEVIDVRVETHPSAPWLAIVGNDFYLHSDGTRPDYETAFKFEKVKVSSSDYTVGYSGNGNASVRFQGMNEVSINELSIENFQFCYRHADVTTASVGSKSVHLRKFRSGVQMMRSETCLVGDVFAQGDAENPEFMPGANALVVLAIKDFICGDVTASDIGEHGVRITSGFGNSEAAGLVSEQIETKASFGNIRVYRAGGCGFKAASGGEANLPPIQSVQLGTLYVEDAGKDDFDSDGTFEGNNHFGLNLQNVNYFACASFVTKRQNNLHNGKHCLMVRGVGEFSLGNILAGGSYSDVIFWNATRPTTNVYIGSGSAYDYGRGGSGRAMSILNYERLGRVNVNLDASDGPSLMNFTGSGNPANFYKVTCTYFNVTDPTVTGAPTSRMYFNISPSSKASNSGATNYAVGDVLFCQGQGGSGSLLRNSVADVYLSADTSRGFVAVPVNFTPSEEVLRPVPGVWRARGQSADGSYVMVQKVGT